MSDARTPSADPAATGPCPICKKPARHTAANQYRPFCGECCKLVDLGRWLDGKYVVPGEPAVGFEDFPMDDEFLQGSE